MPTEFREQAKAPVHASPVGASALHRASVQIVPLSAMVVFLVTATLLAGPPDVVRSAILVAYVVAGAGICRTLFRLTSRAGWDRRPWLQALAVSSACAVIVGTALFAMQSMRKGVARWETLPWILALAFGLSMSACAVTTVARLRVMKPAPAEVAGRASFMDRLPMALRGADLLAVQAEDHYLRVHTSQGDALILMRLSDAIAELDGIDGAQVHRSWWVARAAIKETVRDGREATLLLRNDLKTPVSRSRLKELRSQNWF